MTIKRRRGVSPPPRRRPSLGRCRQSLQPALLIKTFAGGAKRRSSHGIVSTRSGVKPSRKRSREWIRPICVTPLNLMHCLVACALAASLSAGGAISGRETAGEYVDDGSATQ